MANGRAQLADSQIQALAHRARLVPAAHPAPAPAAHPAPATAAHPARAPAAYWEVITSYSVTVILTTAMNKVVSRKRLRSMYVEVSLMHNQRAQFLQIGIGQQTGMRTAQILQSAHDARPITCVSLSTGSARVSRDSKDTSCRPLGEAGRVWYASVQSTLEHHGAPLISLSRFPYKPTPRSSTGGCLL